MPTNVTIEYAKAQEKFLLAKTREEKISALEEMIAKVPKHKGTENLQAQLKSKLAKLKAQKEAKAGRKSFAIPKEGDAQICILGLTQSGKSTLLSKLTNAKPKISSIPYTTTKPEVGTAEWQGVKLQLIEIPSTFQPIYMSIAQNCDGLILVRDPRKDIAKQTAHLKQVLAEFRIKKPFIEISETKETEKIKEQVWKMLGLIRIYTKEPGKAPEKKALVLRKGATVAQAAKVVHKDFLKFFRFARLWGLSAKFPGEKIGLEHILQDGDILEIHA